MADFLKSMSIAASGLRAQAGRMRIISENIANADSTAARPGADPYRRKVPSFNTQLDRVAGRARRQHGQGRHRQVRFQLKYEPGHPSADASGNVKYPNVNSLVEMTDYARGAAFIRGQYQRDQCDAPDAPAHARYSESVTTRAWRDARAKRDRRQVNRRSWLHHLRRRRLRQHRQTFDRSVRRALPVSAAALAKAKPVSPPCSRRRSTRCRRLAATGRPGAGDGQRQIEHGRCRHRGGGDRGGDRCRGRGARTRRSRPTKKSCGCRSNSAVMPAQAGIQWSPTTK